MWRKKIILLYVVILGFSSIARWAGRGNGSPGVAGFVTLPVVDRGEITDKSIRFAYEIRPSRRSPDAPPISSGQAPWLVLLHGSPGDRSQVTGLARQHSPDFPVLLPDLPGFGQSTKNIPDYSIDAHARYLTGLLDELSIERAHFIGFSLGGGVALEFAESHPARVASLTLLASIGVQELELLGDHTLNHAVHGFQLAALWLLRNATPHFGVLDHSMVDHAYARNFFDTDQRPLRGILENLDAPTLNLHGKEDFLVPVSAAREHARIVPQSELLLFEGGHFRIFQDPASLAKPISEFVARVEAGEAPTRATANPSRLAAATAPFVWKLHGHPRPISLPLMGALLAMATWITEDITCISAGVLSGAGATPLSVAILACFIGIFTGDFLVYLGGRALGLRALQRAPLRWLIASAQVERSARFFESHGPKLILTTRFIPGTRLPTYFAAGLFGIGFWRFSGWFLLAAGLWVPLVVCLSSLAGTHMLRFFERYERYTFFLLIAGILALLLSLKLIAPLSSHIGRRLLLGRWRRATRWEFWPAWALYPPVVLSILGLAIRHRSLTLFTAVNPGISGGGLVGESKSAILSRFGKNCPQVASFRLLPTALSLEEKLAALEDFLRAESLDYPIVLKPDQGERGQGVAVLDNPGAAREYLARCPLAVIAQEFVPGEEFGVFYIRHPKEDRGRLFSLTEKILIHVIGDGKRTLEDLILEDDRAVCMAPLFLDRFAARVGEIPAPGENIPLTHLGTHCRGALFLDAAGLDTPELSAAIDRLSKRFEGFHFGRYDLRVPSRRDLQAGINFKILELNGVTSEATHIYDPRHRYLYGVRTLIAQWKIAFDIAAANVQNGAQPATLREVIGLLKHFRHRKKFEI